MSGRFHVVLDNTIGELGMEGVDLADEHCRWRLYQSAIDRSVCMGLMNEIVGLEEDRNLAISVVLETISRTDLGEHDHWISQLRESERPYCVRRSRETNLLRTLDDSCLEVVDIREGMAEWSDWLQLRLADSIYRVEFLEIIAEQGRTKRIRRIARQRISDLSLWTSWIRRLF